MFNALLEAFRTPDLRNKILFTLGMLVVFRFLAHVPLPGVDQEQLQIIINQSQLLNLLNQTIPALERLSKEGEYGRNKINQYTRILTVPLALLQGIGVAVFMQRSNVIPEFGPSNLGLTLAILSSLTAGTLILMWLGEPIRERGIGQRISFNIFPGIRPGRPTADFLQRVVTRITIAGALFLGIVAVMPTLIGDITGVQTLRLGGTSILIVVGVVVETMKQLEAQLLQRSYEGFIR